jgi:hypothetical protein
LTSLVIHLLNTVYQQQNLPTPLTLYLSTPPSITNTMLNIGQAILEFLSTLSTLSTLPETQARCSPVSKPDLDLLLLKSGTFKGYSSISQAILEILSTLSTLPEILTFINNYPFSRDAIEFYSGRNLGTSSRSEIEIGLKTVE